MAWWMWMVLWSVMILSSCAFILGVAWKVVVHKVLPAMRDVETFADDFTAQWNAAAQGTSQPLRTSSEPAVFTPISTARAAFTRDRDQRQSARLIRRMNRKRANGQPQLLSDIRRAERKGIHHAR